LVFPPSNQPTGDHHSFQSMCCVERAIQPFQFLVANLNQNFGRDPSRVTSRVRFTIRSDLRPGDAPTVKVWPRLIFRFGGEVSFPTPRRSFRRRPATATPRSRRPRCACCPRTLTHEFICPSLNPKHHRGHQEYFFLKKFPPVHMSLFGFRPHD